MTAVCVIPGKLGIIGQEVAQLWLEGRLLGIVSYNEFEALTTYLILLRMAFFGGFFNQVQYEKEQERVRNLLSTE